MERMRCGVLCDYFPMWETHLFAHLNFELHFQKMANHTIVRGDRDSRATLMPIYGDLYQIKL